MANRYREEDNKKYVILNDIGPVMADIVSEIEDEKYVYAPVFTNTYYWMTRVGNSVTECGSFGIVKEKLKDCLFPQVSGVYGTEEDPFFVDKSFVALRPCTADCESIEMFDYRYRNEPWQQEKAKKWGSKEVEHKMISVGCFPYLRDFLDLVKGYQDEQDKRTLTKEELERLKEIFLSDFKKEEQKENRIVQFFKKRVK